ncbi:hypothetical protein L1080_037605 [Rhodococcus sp. MSC1_016]|jgi:hypothetical protein|uniref:hypothetical protein n=1 Tax=Rhodococcus sp. MSC1_016 TaxID=2909266 RepID=UPI00203054E5|nr:hypothetical protein [Rhodococcus sp. MSC1_016]
MTDSVSPRRTITGLAPRAVTGDLSRLRAQSRNVAPAQVQQGPQHPQEQVVPPATPTEPEKKPSNKAVTVYIAPDVYKQARLAFKATRTVESDRNWSHFVEKALADATQRRAMQHNDGDFFGGEDTPLPPGRPLADD